MNKRKVIWLGPCILRNVLKKHKEIFNPDRVMEGQKEGKKIKTLSTKSTGRDAISQWQFAEAETKQESKNKRVNILL